MCCIRLGNETSAQRHEFLFVECDLVVAKNLFFGTFSLSRHEVRDKREALRFVQANQVGLDLGFSDEMYSC